MSSALLTASQQAEATGLIATVQQRLDHLTKPPGSLGLLEALAMKLAVIQRSSTPRHAAPQVLVFAGDHGLAAEGISAYPSAVTRQMVLNFLGGGAAISVLAAAHGAQLTVVDAGVAGGPFPAHPQLCSQRLGEGTASALQGAAMTLAEAEQALAAGRAVVAATLDASPATTVLVLGEMGIGNTASAALLMHHFTGVALDDCIGRGTGLDDVGLARKRSVLHAVVQRHGRPATALQALAAFGGFEIAQLAGALLEAQARKVAVLVDGFIVGAALLVAQALEPRVLEVCIFAHRSAEQGHRKMLEHLQARPLLDWRLRLGEGSGAALTLPLLAAAIRILDGMATFASAGVSQA
jgi:nicotinate-nucleotide--dimethylbenzimidazole phosphoribosyltransferase